MNKIIRKINNGIGEIVASLPNDTSQTSTDSKTGKTEISKEIKQLCRQAVCESAVLLKNENNVLPLSGNDIVSVFSITQLDWFYSGYGSGGDVNAPYKVNLIDGLKSAGVKLNLPLLDIYTDYSSKHPADAGFWAHWPTYREEMKLDGKTVRDAAKISNKAIVVIGRSSGEDMDNTLTRGSWYLTEKELNILTLVTNEFSDVILLINSCGIIDMSRIEEFGSKISSIMYVWQGGMESGNGVADLLTGKAAPSGKLSDTIARFYDDYPSSRNFGKRDRTLYAEDIYVGYRWFETFAPDKVMYPFGFGLSYTDFSLKKIKFEKSRKIRVTVDVTNIGNYAGKETVQVYFSAPDGRLGKPSRTLVAYKKTGLLQPGESEHINIFFDADKMASYDDTKEFSFILEKGKYTIFVGTDVRSAEKFGDVFVQNERIVKRLGQKAAPVVPFRRVHSIGDGKYILENVTLAKNNLKNTILNNLPEGLYLKNPNKMSLSDVRSSADLEAFAETLSDAELEAISRGDYVMNSPLGPSGNGGVLCGVTESLREKGIKPVVFTDGPSGIRLNSYASMIPIATALCCTMNPELVENLYAEVGKEMKKLGSMVIAAPALNIHRNPLCGRNFEYFSEDPLLSGIMAAAVVKGVQSCGVSACPKHFACNNQELNRTHNDSILSERALREIYLKGFEICVKEASPRCIMTSYNKINGVWGHYHFELVTGILRKEWGYSGCVITDWWMRSARSPEFSKLRDQSYRVRSGVNVLMPGGSRSGKRIPDGTLLESLEKKDGITRGELIENAKHILKFAMSFDDENSAG